MIRLIASDVDGTLVPEGTSKVNPHLFDLIRKLKENDVLFAAASGRQYTSILKVFEPVRDDILFVADNGSIVMDKGELIACSAFAGHVWKDIVNYIHTLPDVSLMLSSVEGSFSDQATSDFLRRMQEGYGIRIDPVQDLLSRDLHVTKVAIYTERGDAPAQAVPGRERFGDDAHVLVSGDCWVDFVTPGSDKGHAIQQIQKHFGILKEETMAFGDECNDIGMLKSAGESYAVANARPEVRDVARYVMTEGAEEDGVLHVLQKMLAI